MSPDSLPWSPLCSSSILSPQVLDLPGSLLPTILSLPPPHQEFSLLLKCSLLVLILRTVASSGTCFWPPTASGPHICQFEVWTFMRYLSVFILLLWGLGESIWVPAPCYRTARSFANAIVSGHMCREHLCVQGDSLHVQEPTFSCPTPVLRAMAREVTHWGAGVLWCRVAVSTHLANCVCKEAWVSTLITAANSGLAFWSFIF